jgi:hypothetical protein
VRLRDWRAPDEVSAGSRTWDVVGAAFRGRDPVPVAHRRTRPLALACVVLAVAAGAAATTPGRAVIGSLRRAVGVEHARPVLFALPTAGRLLVGSSSGPWIVRADGSKRLLAGWDDAAWSPFGRYVVATGHDEVAALDEDGHVRWTLARPRARLAAWGGTPTDTRIAYLTRSRLHVVGGDGRHDVDAALRAAADVRPAWRPGKPFVVAYADTRGRIAAYETDTGALRWRTPPLPGVRSLAWSADGTHLLAVSKDKVATIRNGILRVTYRGSVSTAAFGPHDELALARTRAGASEVRVGDRVVFRGTGRFGGLAFSPDGGWLLVSWPTADQWVLVHLRAPHRLVAVSRVTDDLGGGAFPQLEGWCCGSR